MSLQCKQSQQASETRLEGISLWVHTYTHVLLCEQSVIHSLLTIVWCVQHVKARAVGIGRTAEISLMTSSARKCFEVV